MYVGIRIGKIFNNYSNVTFRILQAYMNFNGKHRKWKLKKAEEEEE